MLCFTPCVNARGYPLLAPHHLAGDLVAAFDALACPERGGGGCLPADVIAVRGPALTSFCTPGAPACLALALVSTCSDVGVPAYAVAHAVSL